MTFKIEISGLVQGVGFRPFIHRLASSYQLKGWVENRNDGVLILFNCSEKVAYQFKDEIIKEAPPASNIEEILLTKGTNELFDQFQIKSSEDVSDMVTEISPDIAVCNDCLMDMKSQPHRRNYPFINCTNCGPRFSIIRELPYDRLNTTMDIFRMCKECRKEYININDRRFHAQPVACIHCGPSMTLIENGKETRSLNLLLEKVKIGLSEDKVYAIKGMGGYHLMCNALSEKAIASLRQIKVRDGKPFALMFRSIQDAKIHVDMDAKEEEELISWKRPILLLRKKGVITKGIADGLSSLGVMLPYMPFHHLLFEILELPALVLTSGNISDEPILISNTKAIDLFGKKVDGLITYNREIHNRNDDSVSIVIHDAPQVIRRSRGYAPSSIGTQINTEGIFAAGAELYNSFCMGKGNKAFMSQYIGDLKNLETFRFYEEIYERFSQMFRFRPELIVHDLHPDYLSTNFARKLSKQMGNIPLLEVQHHHAHTASVMLANKLEGEVIGFSMDGMGLGSDGNLWGGEILLADYKDYNRLYHFEYVPLPGGDKANKQPWRMAVSYLQHVYGNAFKQLPLPLLKEIDQTQINHIQVMMDKSLNTPLISSSGRLFDAVSALLGLNYFSTYQAEAPMLLESIADSSEKGRYEYGISDQQVLFEPMIRCIVEDVIEKTSNATIAGRFHNTMVELMVELAIKIRKEHRLKRIVLSGGSFQNRILTEKIITRLSHEDFDVYLPRIVPVNDQGIALGQLAIAAAKR